VGCVEKIKTSFDFCNFYICGAFSRYCPNLPTPLRRTHLWMSLLTGMVENIRQGTEETEAFEYIFGDQGVSSSLILRIDLFEFY